MQELLCSVGRVLTDTVGVVEAAGNVPVGMKSPKSEGVSATEERDEGGGSGVPHPLVSVALQLMLAVVPNDLSGDNSCRFVVVAFFFFYLSFGIRDCVPKGFVCIRVYPRCTW